MKMIVKFALVMLALVASRTDSLARCIESKSGSVMCNAACVYVYPIPECRVDMQLSWQDYCYFDYNACTCHEGAGDPCCDSGGI